MLAKNGYLNEFMQVKCKERRQIVAEIRRKRDGQRKMASQRKKGLGGTDISAICGLHPYVSRAQVWSDKLGLTEVQENELMKWGKILEAPIAREYGEREGKKVILLADQIVTQERDGVKLFGSPDAAVWLMAPTPAELADIMVLMRGAERGLEIKTASSWAKGWGHGAAEIPEHYYVQCQWYMAITGLKRWDLAVLIGGNDFRIYRLEAHPSLQKALIEMGVKFWKDYVETQTPPPADASESYLKTLGQLIPAKAEPMLGDEAMDKIAERIKRLRDELEAKDQELRLAKNQLIEVLHKHDTSSAIADNWRANFVQMKGRKSVDYKRLIKDLNISAETLAKYEKVGQDFRTFRFQWKGDDE